MPKMNKRIQFNYRNRKGNIKTRTVTPKMVYWDEEDGWVLNAYDHDVDEEKDFKVTNIYGMTEALNEERPE